jgi:hypothetical protein
VDDVFLGAYELPARFPVLKSGKQNIQIWPGIKKNGIAATRVSYQFYNPIEKEITLTPDSTLKLGRLKTTYQTSAQFIWKEDFEDVAFSLDTTSRSMVGITLTKSSDSTFEGMHSGRVVLTSANNFFECQTRNEYAIPAAPVYLEMNFNTNNSLNVGVITYGTTVLYQSPVLTLNPTNGQWRKIYIELTNALNAYQGMLSFRVYLGAFKDTGVSEGVIMFDNFKVLTRLAK